MNWKERWLAKRNIWIKITVMILVFVLGGLGFYRFQMVQRKQEQAALVESLASKVIRFHVLANSDQETDQQLKLTVRDAIGGYLSEELAGVQSEEESRQIITDDMDEIVQVAQRVITQEGYDYPVTASLTRTDFPEKTYGDYTFPAGEYEALQVIIGTGNGKNWWCVMYPNLCFFNSMYEADDEEGAKSLEKVLTKEEYKAIMESGKYKVRFKWLSFLNPNEE